MGARLPTEAPLNGPATPRKDAIDGNLWLTAIQRSSDWAAAIVPSRTAGSVTR
jgi:hypothetical protein